MLLLLLSLLPSLLEASMYDYLFKYNSTAETTYINSVYIIFNHLNQYLDDL